MSHSLTAAQAIIVFIHRRWDDAPQPLSSWYPILIVVLLLPGAQWANQFSHMLLNGMPGTFTVVGVVCCHWLPAFLVRLPL